MEHTRPRGTGAGDAGSGPFLASFNVLASELTQVKRNRTRPAPKQTPNLGAPRGGFDSIRIPQLTMISSFAHPPEETGLSQAQPQTSDERVKPPGILRPVALRASSETKSRPERQGSSTAVSIIPTSSSRDQAQLISPRKPEQQPGTVNSCSSPHSSSQSKHALGGSQKHQQQQPSSTKPFDGTTWFFEGCFEKPTLDPTTDEDSAPELVTQKAPSYLVDVSGHAPISEGMIRSSIAQLTASRINRKSKRFVYSPVAERILNIQLVRTLLSTFRVCPPPPSLLPVLQIESQFGQDNIQSVEYKGVEEALERYPRIPNPPPSPTLVVTVVQRLIQSADVLSKERPGWRKIIEQLTTSLVRAAIHGIQQGLAYMQSIQSRSTTSTSLPPPIIPILASLVASVSNGARDTCTPYIEIAAQLDLAYREWITKLHLWRRFAAAERLRDAARKRALDRSHQRTVVAIESVVFHRWKSNVQRLRRQRAALIRSITPLALQDNARLKYAFTIWRARAAHTARLRSEGTLSRLRQSNQVAQANKDDLSVRVRMLTANEEALRRGIEIQRRALSILVPERDRLLKVAQHAIRDAKKHRTRFTATLELLLHATLHAKERLMQLAASQVQDITMLFLEPPETCALAGANSATAPWLRTEMNSTGNGSDIPSWAEGPSTHYSHMLRLYTRAHRALIALHRDVLRSMALEAQGPTDAPTETDAASNANTHTAEPFIREILRPQSKPSDSNADSAHDVDLTDRPRSAAQPALAPESAMWEKELVYKELSALERIETLTDHMNDITPTTGAGRQPIGQTPTAAASPVAQSSQFLPCPVGSAEWLRRRKEVLRLCCDCLEVCGDQDILLLWINAHLFRNHIRVLRAHRRKELEAFYRAVNQVRERQQSQNPQQGQMSAETVADDMVSQATGKSPGKKRLKPRGTTMPNSDKGIPGLSGPKTGGVSHVFSFSNAYYVNGLDLSNPDALPSPPPLSRTIPMCLVPFITQNHSPLWPMLRPFTRLHPPSTLFDQAWGLDPTPILQSDRDSLMQRINQALEAEERVETAMLEGLKGSEQLGRRANSFSRHFSDGEILLRLFAGLYPDALGLDAMASQDPHVRARRVLDILYSPAVVKRHQQQPKASSIQESDASTNPNVAASLLDAHMLTCATLPDVLAAGLAEICAKDFSLPLAHTWLPPAPDRILPNPAIAPRLSALAAYARGADPLSSLTAVTPLSPTGSRWKPTSDTATGIYVDESTTRNRRAIDKAKPSRVKEARDGARSESDAIASPSKELSTTATPKVPAKFNNLSIRTDDTSATEDEDTEDASDLNAEDGGSSDKSDVNAGSTSRSIFSTPTKPSRGLSSPSLKRFGTGRSFVDTTASTDSGGSGGKQSSDFSSRLPHSPTRKGLTTALEVIHSTRALTVAPWLASPMSVSQVAGSTSKIADVRSGGSHNPSVPVLASPSGLKTTRGQGRRFFAEMRTPGSTARRIAAAASAMVAQMSAEVARRQAEAAAAAAAGPQQLKHEDDESFDGSIPEIPVYGYASSNCDLPTGCLDVCIANLAKLLYLQQRGLDVIAGEPFLSKYMLEDSDTVGDSPYYESSNLDTALTELEKLLGACNQRFEQRYLAEQARAKQKQIHQSQSKGACNANDTLLHADNLKILEATNTKTDPEVIQVRLRHPRELHRLRRERPDEFGTLGSMNPTPQAESRVPAINSQNKHSDDQGDLIFSVNVPRRDSDLLLEFDSNEPSELHSADSTLRLSPFAAVLRSTLETVENVIADGRAHEEAWLRLKARIQAFSLSLLSTRVRSGQILETVYRTNSTAQAFSAPIAPAPLPEFVGPGFVSGQPSSLLPGLYERRGSAASVSSKDFSRGSARLLKVPAPLCVTIAGGPRLGPRVTALLARLPKELSRNSSGQIAVYHRFPLAASSASVFGLSTTKIALQTAQVRPITLPDRTSILFRMRVVSSFLGPDPASCWLRVALERLKTSAMFEGNGLDLQLSMRVAAFQTAQATSMHSISGSTLRAILDGHPALSKMAAQEVRLALGILDQVTNDVASFSQLRNQGALPLVQALDSRQPPQGMFEAPPAEGTGVNQIIQERLCKIAQMARGWIGSEPRFVCSPFLRDVLHRFQRELRTSPAYASIREYVQGLADQALKSIPNPKLDSVDEEGPTPQRDGARRSSTDLASDVVPAMLLLLAPHLPLKAATQSLAANSSASSAANDTQTTPQLGSSTPRLVNRIPSYRTANSVNTGRELTVPETPQAQLGSTPLSSNRTLAPVTAADALTTSPAALALAWLSASAPRILADQLGLCAQYLVEFWDVLQGAFLHYSQVDSKVAFGTTPSSNQPTVQAATQTATNNAADGEGESSTAIAAPVTTDMTTSVSMNKFEFYVFVKECKFTGISVAMADAIFDAATADDPEMIALNAAAQNTQNQATNKTTSRRASLAVSNSAASSPFSPSLLAAAASDMSRRASLAGFSDGVDLSRLDDGREMTFQQFLGAIIRFAAVLQPGASQRRYAIRLHSALYSPRPSPYPSDMQESRQGPSTPLPTTPQVQSPSAEGPQSPAPGKGNRGSLTLRRRVSLALAMPGLLPRAAHNPLLAGTDSQTPGAQISTSPGSTQAASQTGSSMTRLVYSGGFPFFVIDRSLISAAIATGILTSDPFNNNSTLCEWAGVSAADQEGANVVAEESEAKGTTVPETPAKSRDETKVQQLLTANLLRLDTEASKAPRHDLRGYNDEDHAALGGAHTENQTKALIHYAKQIMLVQQQIEAEQRKVLAKHAGSYRRAYNTLLERLTARDQGMVALPAELSFVDDHSPLAYMVGPHLAYVPSMTLAIPPPLQPLSLGPVLKTFTVSATGAAWLSATLRSLPTVRMSLHHLRLSRQADILEGDTLPRFGTLVGYGAPDTWNPTSFQLWQRLYCILAVYITPNAGRVNNQPFRNQYRRLDVARVFREYYKPLHRIFMHYVGIRMKRAAKGSNNPTVVAGVGDLRVSDTPVSTMGVALASLALQSSSITIVEFQMFLKDLGLLSPKFGLTPATVYALFSNIQQDSDVTPVVVDNPLADAAKAGQAMLNSILSNNDKQQADKDPLSAEETISRMHASATQANSISDLIFPEFLEGIAAITCFRYPDPYASLATKLELFLKNDVIPWAKRSLHIAI